MTNWKELLPEVNLQLQIGSSDNRVSICIYSSGKMKTLSFSAGLLPNIDEYDEQLSAWGCNPWYTSALNVN